MYDFDPDFYKNFAGMLRPAFDVALDCSIENPHLIPNEGPGIIVSNHKSDMDPFLILSNIKRPIHWFAGSYLYNIPVWGNIMKKLGAIPVSKDTDEIKEAFKMAKEVLDRGGLVGVFPEGWEYISEGRFNAPVGRFQTGFVRLAVQTNAPIIPMAVVGLRARTESQALPPWLRKVLNFPFELQYNPSRLQFEKVHMIVGRPLHIPQPEGKPSHDFLTEWAETARSAVVALESQVIGRRQLEMKDDQGIRHLETINPLEARLEYFLDRLAENPGELRGQLEYQAGPGIADALQSVSERMLSHMNDGDSPADLIHAALVLGYLSRLEVETEMPKHPIADPATAKERRDVHKLLMRLIQPKREAVEGDGRSLTQETEPSALPQPKEDIPEE